MLIPIHLDGDPKQTRMVDFHMLPATGDYVDDIAGEKEPVQITGRFWKLVEMELPQDPGGLALLGQQRKRVHALFLVAHRPATVRALQAAARGEAPPPEPNVAESGEA